MFALYNFYYSDKILPHTFISTMDVSSITQDAAAERLHERFGVLYDGGIILAIENNEEIIDPINIDLLLPSNILAQSAWSFGREGGWYEQLWERLIAPFYSKRLSVKVEFSEEKLKSEIGALASLYDVLPQDVRYDIEGLEVGILYDTKLGKYLDRAKAQDTILTHVKNFDENVVELSLEIDLPKADPALADEAKKYAEQIIASPLTLVYGDWRFTLRREKIASWVISRYDGVRLMPDFDERLVSDYVVELADKVDITTQNSKVIEKDGKVVDFIAPRHGRTLLQDDTVGLITETLFERVRGEKITKKISLPVLVKKPESEGTASELGIIELIGKATTPFYGSPKNRVHNITNGVRFLTGVLVSPGEVFSTVGTLGQIDNTTGYLPELVIKGDETIPEFGGGLCQVSTTLFRSVLNAGLPVVSRRNHSYRVPYYERDGEGNFIGPGLDATIYSPWPDFKFKNDTENHILVQGYVDGFEATFELYGTGDGRKSFVDGPHTLTEEPPGDPIYIETEDLPKGETKKIDTAHPGGTAVATYTIEYADGTIDEQEFKSIYRKWPAKYLIGTATTTMAIELSVE